MDGVSHTVEVTAATLYEAVAQGLAAIRGNEWVAGIAQGLNVVKISVANPNNYTVETIALKVSRSPAYVHGRLQLLNLVDEAKQAFRRRNSRSRTLLKSQD
jgi:hypothetical protein